MFAVVFLKYDFLRYFFVIQHVSLCLSTDRGENTSDSRHG